MRAVAIYPHFIISRASTTQASTLSSVFFGRYIRSTMRNAPVANRATSAADMVNGAIVGIRDRRGSTLRAIKKYIGKTYECDVDEQSIFIKKYLKSAIEKNTIVQIKGFGASSRFKLGVESKDEKKVAKKPEAAVEKPEAAEEPSVSEEPEAANPASSHSVRSPQKSQGLFVLTRTDWEPISAEQMDHGRELETICRALDERFLIMHKHTIALASIKALPRQLLLERIDELTAHTEEIQIQEESIYDLIVRANALTFRGVPLSEIVEKYAAKNDISLPGSAETTKH